MRSRIPAMVVLAVTLAAFATGCSASDTRYYLGAFEQNQDLRELFRLFSREKDQENRFVLIQQIASALANSGKREKEIIFLTTHVEKNPSDLYNAYYLLLVAEAYSDMKEIPLAIHYYRRILMNNADLLVQGRSIHLQCLEDLQALETDPEHRIEYYKELISRFGSQIEHPAADWYYMARSYEEVGEWDQAVQAYNKYLSYPDTDIPGEPNAYRIANEKVNLYSTSNIDWTVPDLGTLVAAVRDAIQTKNISTLRKFQAKANFYEGGWDQQSLFGDPTGEGFTAFNIGTYLPGSYPKIDASLDVAANGREAYLRTTDWNFRPPTWYLYFRRVDFPADPDVNGQWEWAGIYFGEKIP
ncbi:MAG: tetratricopeptide repeat protein [Spirochaetia bacterium]